MATIKKISKGGTYISPGLKLKHIENNIKKLNNLIKNLDNNSNYLGKTGKKKNYLEKTKIKLKEGLENLMKEHNITEIELKKHIEDGQKSRGTYNYEKNKKKADIESKISEINRKLKSINDAKKYDERMLEFLKQHKEIESIGVLQMGKSKARKDLYAKYRNMLDARKTKNKRTQEAIFKYHQNAAEFRKIYTTAKTIEEIDKYTTKINSRYDYDNKVLTIYELYEIIYNNELEELKFEKNKLSGNSNDLIPPNKENLPIPDYSLFGVFEGSNLSGGKKKPATKKPVTKKPVTKKPVTKKPVKKSTSKSTTKK